MMKKQLLLTITALVFFTLGFTSTAMAKQAETPAPSVVHATFDTADLHKNLSTKKIVLAAEQTEKVTFKVFVNEHGNVADLTFSHNIPAEKAKKADSYIQKAYKAIMATDFYPAKKDGKNIADVLTIEFVVVD